MRIYTSFREVMKDIRGAFIERSAKVEVGHWQGLGELPLLELFNYHFTYEIPGSLRRLKEDIRPNLPWADDHFEERVSRVPYNPAPSYKWWPWWREESEVTQREGERFDFSYPERIWTPSLPGLMRPFGNLNNVINLLVERPYTKQAWLPLFFPEDTGNVHRGRTMCSLGYHFIQRDGRFHIFYCMRSCDFIRYFQDDAYLACRMARWVLSELKRKSHSWRHTALGHLIMHIFSLHIGPGELSRVAREESYTVQTDGAWRSRKT